MEMRCGLAARQRDGQHACKMCKPHLGQGNNLIRTSTFITSDMHLWLELEGRHVYVQGDVNQTGVGLLL